MSKLTIALYAILVVSAVSSLILSEEANNSDHVKNFDDFEADNGSLRTGRARNKTRPGDGIFDALFSSSGSKKNRTSSSSVSGGGISGFFEGYNNAVSRIVEGVGNFSKRKIDVVKVLTLTPGEGMKIIAEAWDKGRDERMKYRQRLGDVAKKPFRTIFNRQED